jgi:hypothetical protein
LRCWSFSWLQSSPNCWSKSSKSAMVRAESPRDVRAGFAGA